MRHSLQTLLELVGTEAIPEFPTGTGHADLRLPACHAVIECKAPGKAGPQRLGAGANETQAD